MTSVHKSSTTITTNKVVGKEKPNKKHKRMEKPPYENWWMLPGLYRECEELFQRENLCEYLKEGDRHFALFNENITFDDACNTHHSKLWPSGKLQGVMGFVKFTFHDTVDDCPQTISYWQDYEMRFKHPCYQSLYKQSLNGYKEVGMAVERGKKLHNIIADFFSRGYFEKVIKFGNLLENELSQFRCFLNEFFFLKKLKPFKINRTIESTKYPIFGHLDSLFVDRRGDFVLIDFIVCNVIGFELDVDVCARNEFGSGHFRNMAATELNKHFVRLNIYRHILREYQIVVNQMYLVVLDNRPNTSYKIYLVTLVTEFEMHDSLASMFRDKSKGSCDNNKSIRNRLRPFNLNERLSSLVDSDGVEEAPKQPAAAASFAAVVASKPSPAKKKKKPSLSLVPPPPPRPVQSITDRVNNLNESTVTSTNTNTISNNNDRINQADNPMNSPSNEAALVDIDYNVWKLPYQARHKTPDSSNSCNLPNLPARVVLVKSTSSSSTQTDPATAHSTASCDTKNTIVEIENKEPVSSAAVPTSTGDNS